MIGLADFDWFIADRDDTTGWRRYEFPSGWGRNLWPDGDGYTLTRADGSQQTGLTEAEVIEQLSWSATASPAAA